MGLLQIITESNDARKLFGKKELKIIEKQLLGVSLTQSEKNRLSRDIRKKLGFIKKIARFEDEFGLKKGTEIKKIVNESRLIILTDILRERMIKIVLFGSAIENKLALRSDIDIAVEFNKISIQEATLFRKRILGKVNKRVDVQAYNLLPKNIQEGINAKGKIIYKNEPHNRQNS